MRLSHLFVIFAGVALLGPAGSACTSSSGGGSCPPYTPPAGFDAQNPKVSFAKDVLPIFQQSCAFSSCHGSTIGASDGVFLGSDPAKVYPTIVNVKSPELPTMNIVTPNDTDNSFMMHKVDGTQCGFDAKCTNATCQDSMPKGDVVLPAATRDVIRRWILQGAQNN